MKTIETEVQCSCCGVKVKVKICVSRYIGDAGLDNKPENEEGFPILQKCPECGYCDFSIGDDTCTSEMRKIVESAPYQALVNSKAKGTEIEKRLKAMQMLAADSEKAAYLSMLLCWHYEWSGNKDTACAERRKAIGHLEKTFEKAAPAETVLIYIDSLRQLKEFKQAGETIQSVEEGMESCLAKDSLLYRVFQFEKQAVKRGDFRSHTLKEV